MKLTFLGAAGEVTGSQHLVEADRLRLLLDCGLFQGRRAESYEKNSRFLCTPPTLDGLILSHAHIDHCGNLPGLYRAGFRGPIYCTRATADVTGVMLRDSLYIQQEDARYLARHGDPHVRPLYEEEHVRGVMKLIEPVDYSEWTDLFKGVRLRFSDAGHILGSAATELEIDDAGTFRRLVFTGDLGRRGLPLLRDPQLISGGCDVLITESTYAGTIHPPADDLKERLLKIIEQAVENRGRVVIPAFSLGRTQQVVYFLNDLHQSGRLPRVPVYVDSPLANRLTEIYFRHQELMDDESAALLKRDNHLFEFPMLRYVETQQESMQLNREEGPMIIISASGMCESGRVRHHLKQAVAHERNTIVMIGFQAENTLGRRIASRQDTVKIFDRILPLRAKVETLSGLSAHADADDFKWYFEHLAKNSHIGQAFLVHGEPQAAKSLATLLHDMCDEDPMIPQLYGSYEV